VPRQRRAAAAGPVVELTKLARPPSAMTDWVPPAAARPPLVDENMAPPLVDENMAPPLVESGLLLALPSLASFTGRWRATSLAPGHPPVPVERRFPPHLTLLIPWLDPTAPAALAQLQALAARHPPLRLVFREASTFDHGRVVWLVPDPSAALTSLLTDTLATFPQCPPYGGLHQEVIPHVTVSAESDPQTLPQVRAELARCGPLAAEVDCITVFAREPEQVWRGVAKLPLTGNQPPE
jgi:2'-5' RNA ligase